MSNLIRKFLSSAVALLIMMPSAEAALSPMAGAPMDPSAVTGDTIGTVGENTFKDEPSNVNRSAGVSLPKTPITMNFHEADIRDVLRMLALKSGINIIYGSDVIGTLTLNLDRVPFDQAFQTVLTLKGLVALSTGQRIIRVVSSTALTAEQAQATTFTKVYRLNYANANEVKSPIDAVRSAAGRKGASTVDTKSNALVLTDTPEGLQQSEELIRELDKKPQQVDIEAKIVEVTLSKDTDMGVSWSFARSAGQNKFGAGTFNSGDESAPGSDSRSGSASYYVPNSPAAISASDPGGTGVSFLPTGVGNAALTFLHSESAFQLAATVSALVDKGDAKVLSNPHILTLNNEEARINATTQIPYRTTTTSSGGTVTDNVSFIDAGIKLTVKPTINQDRRITLKVKPEVSERAALFGDPPPIRTRNVETTVTLKDGETLAIGGLIQENDARTVSGVPILMSIPLLGFLFKRETVNKSRGELIVFITPRIAGD